MANLLNERLNLDNDDTPKKKKTKKIKRKKTEPQSQIIKPINKNEVLEKNNNSIYDEELEALTADEYIREQKAIKKSNRKIYFTKIFMCFMCAYLLFLIYGVMVTNYDYDEKGSVTAQILSIEDIQNQNEYSALMGYYIEARNIYEKILILNYRYDQSEEDALDLVPEYETVLEDVNKLIVQLKAVTPSKQYSQAYSLLISWVDTDIASFLQEISAAISQNNAEHMQNAINDKTRTYNDCHQLTANMISLGEHVKGVSISELKEWSPEEFLKKEMGDV